MIRSRQRIVWLGLLVIAGCGPAKTEVSGIVRYQGKPLTSGHVIVVDADDMPHPSPISPEGSYTARGVPVGTVRLAVQVHHKRENSEKSSKPLLPLRRRARGLQPGDDDSGKPPKPLLPSRYAAVGTSGLSTTLKPEPNTFDLDLQ
jgi:hypothetical protein